MFKNCKQIFAIMLVVAFCTVMICADVPVTKAYVDGKGFDTVIKTGKVNYIELDKVAKALGYTYSGKINSSIKLSKDGSIIVYKMGKLTGASKILINGKTVKIDPFKVYKSKVMINTTTLKIIFNVKAVEVKNGGIYITVNESSIVTGTTGTNVSPDDGLVYGPDVTPTPSVAPTPTLKPVVTPKPTPEPTPVITAAGYPDLSNCKNLYKYYYSLLGKKDGTVWYYDSKVNKNAYLDSITYKGHTDIDVGKAEGIDSEGFWLSHPKDFGNHSDDKDYSNEWDLKIQMNNPTRANRAIVERIFHSVWPSTSDNNEALQYVKDTLNAKIYKYQARGGCQKSGVYAAYVNGRAIQVYMSDSIMDNDLIIKIGYKDVVIDMTDITLTTQRDLDDDIVCGYSHNTSVSTGSYGYTYYGLKDWY